MILESSYKKIQFCKAHRGLDMRIWTGLSVPFFHPFQWSFLGHLILDLGSEFESRVICKYTNSL